MPTSKAQVAGVKPSVLIFLHSFEPGGVERIALRLSSLWQKTGHSISVFMGRKDGAMRRQFSDAVDYVYAPETRLPIRHFETLWMIVQLARYVTKNQPSLLFAAGNSYAVVAVALKWLLGKNCPLISMKISNDLVRPDMIAPFAVFYRLWLRIQGRHIDHFIAMSAPLAEQIAREMHVPAYRIDHIANPSLDTATQTMTHSIQDKQAGRSFCAVGRLTRQKNLPAMLRAFAKGAQPDDRLTLYGDGPERTTLEKLVRQLDIADRVAFAGFIPSPQEQLAHHDVLLLSSRYEGMPSVILEALEAGLHIVATDCCCSMRWLLDDGLLGTIVSFDDERAFAHAIAHAPSGQRHIQQARAKADLHRIAHIAPEYLRGFERLIAAQPALQTHIAQTPQHITGYAQ